MGHPPDEDRITVAAQIYPRDLFAHGGYMGMLVAQFQRIDRFGIDVLREHDLLRVGKKAIRN